jgi:hypothetical protein
VLAIGGARARAEASVARRGCSRRKSKPPARRESRALGPSATAGAGAPSPTQYSALAIGGARRGERGAAGLFPPQEQAASATRIACAWAERDGGRGRAVADAVIGARNRRRAGARRGERASVARRGCSRRKSKPPARRESRALGPSATAGAVMVALPPTQLFLTLANGGARAPAEASVARRGCSRRKSKPQRDAGGARWGRARRRLRVWSRRRRRSNWRSQLAARGRAEASVARRGCSRRKSKPPARRESRALGPSTTAGVGAPSPTQYSALAIGGARARAEASVARRGCSRRKSKPPARRESRALGPSATAGVVAPSPTQ